MPEHSPDSSESEQGLIIARVVQTIKGAGSYKVADSFC
jgi:hypothetical protein